MTQTTEQERVSLPLDLVNDLLALCTPEDHELRELEKQASRRAQVPHHGYESGAMSGNRVTLFFDTQKNAESWFDGFCDGYDAAERAQQEATVNEYLTVEATSVQSWSACGVSMLDGHSLPSPAECNTMDCQAGS